MALSLESVSTWCQAMPAWTSPARQVLVGQVAATISALSPRRLRVGIDGLSAAGKTTFGHELAAALREMGRPTARASMDDFKHPWRHALQHGYDRTSGEGYYRNAYDLACAEHLLLRPAGRGGSGRVALCAHDPLTGIDHRATVVDLPDDAVVVVDSVFAFRRAYDPFWDYRILVQVDQELALSRGIARDTAMEGEAEATRLHRDRYQIAEALYLAEVDPRSRADVVIDNADVTAPRIIEPHHLVRQRSPGAGTHVQGVVRLEVVDPGEQRGRAVVREAMVDLASRYYRRPATPAEVDAALADDPGEDLVAPSGLLVVATDASGVTLGCAGVRLLPGGLGEVKKVYVAPFARGRGLGQLLVGKVERLAGAHGCTTVRLDTRGDLVEARRLYARMGYVEVEAFNEGPYAEHWFAKNLPAPQQPDRA